MTDRPVNTRVTTEGVDKAAADLTRFGDVGERALNRLRAAATEAGNATAAAGAKMTGSFKLNQAGLMSLQASGVNTFQALASGMSPFTVATTQSAQVLGALVQGGVLTMATFTKFLPVIGTAAAAVGLLVGTAYEAARATKAAAEAEEAYKKALEGTSAALQTAEERQAALAGKRQSDSRIANTAAFAAATKQIREAETGGEGFVASFVGTSLAELRQQKENIENARGVAAATAGRTLLDLRIEIAAREQIIAQANEQLDIAVKNLRLLQDENNLGVNREKAAKEALKVEQERERFLDQINRDIEASIAAENRRNVSVEKYISGLEHAGEFEALSSAEKEVQRALLEAQNKLIDEQGDKLRDLTDAERARIRVAVELREAREAERKAAEKAARDLEREIERATDRGTDRAADILYDGFQGKIKSIGDLLRTTLARAVADALAQAVIRPLIVQPIVQGVMGGGAGAGLTGAAASAAGGGLIGNLGLSDIGASVGGYLAGGLQFVKEGIFNASTLVDPTGAFGVDLLGGGLTGGALGGIAAKLLGLGSGNMVVDTGLGLGGTLLGTAIGGPIGGAIGGFAGTALGGLFGGGVQHHAATGKISFNDQGQAIFTGASTNNYSDSEVNSTTTKFVDTINGLMSSLGLKFGSSYRGGYFTGVGFGEGAASLSSPVLSLLGEGKVQSGSSELDAKIAAYFARSNPALAGKDADQLLSDLNNMVGLFRTIENIDFKPESLTQAEQAIKAIGAQFDAMTARARELGFAEDALLRARDEAIASLTTGFDAANRLAVLHFVDPLAEALQNLADAQAERLKEATALGADLVLLEKRNALERQAVVDQFGGGGALRALLTELTSGSSSAQAPSVVLGSAEARFNSLRDLALAGDPNARSQLPDAIRNLLSASEASFGSGTQFQEREQFVIRTLETLTGAGQAADVAGAVNSLSAQQAVDSATMIDVLQNLYKKLGDVEQALKDREADIQRLLARVA